MCPFLLYPWLLPLHAVSVLPADLFWGFGPSGSGKAPRAASQLSRFLYPHPVRSAHSAFTLQEFAPLLLSRPPAPLHSLGFTGIPFGCSPSTFSLLSPGLYCHLLLPHLEPGPFSLGLSSSAACPLTRPAVCLGDFVAPHPSGLGHDTYYRSRPFFIILLMVSIKRHGVYFCRAFACIPYVAITSSCQVTYFKSCSRKKMIFDCKMLCFGVMSYSSFVVLLFKFQLCVNAALWVAVPDKSLTRRNIKEGMSNRHCILWVRDQG